MNDYKQGQMEGHNEDDNTEIDFDYYDENTDWDEWE